MANTGTHTSEMKNPGPWQIGGSTRALFAGMAVLGALCIAGGISTGQASRVWANVVSNYFLYFCIALGGAFFVALGYVAGAMWNTPVRRIAEGFTTFLPVAAVIGLIIMVFGGHSLYEWMHTDVIQNDALLASKAGYLNPKFAIGRTIGFFLVWLLLARALVRNSLAQDLTGDAAFTLKNMKLSAIFIPFFGVGFSFLSYDYIMSIEAHWFSTMFGVYCFSGLFYSTLCAITIVALLMKRRGLIPLNDDHLQDLGKFMFGFTVFWAYIGFSQFMLIWYANMPEETVYYLSRSHGGWYYVCWAVLIMKFVIPFFLLMPRGAKRCEKHMMRMACFMLVAHWLDYYLLVMPAFAPQGPVFGWIEAGIALGFFGLFALVVSFFYSRVPAMPFRDPRLSEAMSYQVVP